MKLVYPAIFSPLEESEGYCVTVPDLPGCVTQGSSLVNAIEMAVDAASGWILDELEDGNIVPKPSTRDRLSLQSDNAFINLIVLDIDAYAEQYGSNAVRKNCTLPAWLNTAAEKAGINYSGLLQAAIKENLGIESTHQSHH